MNADGENVGPELAPGLAGGSQPRRPSRLWLWFLAAFVLQAVAWTAWLVIASRHPVAEVPLKTSSLLAPGGGVG